MALRSTPGSRSLRLAVVMCLLVFDSRALYSDVLGVGDTTSIVSPDAGSGAGVHVDTVYQLRTLREYLNFGPRPDTTSWDRNANHVPDVAETPANREFTRRPPWRAKQQDAGPLLPIDVVSAYVWPRQAFRPTDPFGRFVVFAEGATGPPEYSVKCYTRSGRRLTDWSRRATHGRHANTSVGFDVPRTDSVVVVRIDFRHGWPVYAEVQTP